MADQQDSIREGILNNIEETLAAIVEGEVPVGGSSGYNYTPDVSLRVSKFGPQLLDTNNGKTLYFITSGLEEPREDTTSKGFLSQLEIFILGCRMIKNISEDPFRRDKSLPQEDTIRNRVIKDIIRALTEDFTRGRTSFPAPVGNTNQADNTRIGPIRIDNGQFYPYVLVEVALTIEYQFWGMEP